jgi:hypothetical protein
LFALTKATMSGHFNATTAKSYRAGWTHTVEQRKVQAMKTATFYHSVI